MKSLVRQTIRRGFYIAIGLAVAVVILLVVSLYSAPMKSSPIIT